MEPLIVDVDQDTRTNLEAAMQESLVVVSYDCRKLKVLPACTLPDASYGYRGISLKEQVKQIEEMDDLAVNFPVSAAKLGAEVKSGRSIDLALYRAGLRKTTVGTVARSELQGSCEGATHFVHSATVGAFTIASGSSGKASAAAEVFSYGGHTSSESEHKSLNRDGSPVACKKSQPGFPSPIGQCQAPISLLLIPVSDTPGAAKKRGEGDDSELTAEPIATQCLPGYVFSDGLCTVEEAAPHVCSPSAIADCEAQCKAGNAESCYNYALSFGKSQDAVLKQGMPQYKKACEGGVADACFALGVALEWELDDEKPNYASLLAVVIDQHQRACNAGLGEGCDHAATYYDGKTNPARDERKAFEAWKAGCDLGDGDSCIMAADIQLHGKGGVSRDAAAAASLLQRSCSAKYADACGDLANILFKGEGGTKKAPLAGAKLMVHACSLDSGWCATAGDMSKSVGDSGLAAKAWQTGCDEEDYESCRKLGQLYAAGEGVSKDATKAKTLFELACAKDEDEEACRLAKR
ncbi:MAG: tetratricopeptide repeat protein [Polyangiaceae bacterium]